MDVVTFAEMREVLRKRAILEFTDGLTIVAIVLDVKEDVGDNHVVYQVIEVRSSGSAMRPALKPGEHYATDISEFARVAAD
jgi:hypothetical protein